jgi:hypothetical protein
LIENLVAKQKHPQAKLECTRDDEKHQLLHVEILVARTFQRLGYGAGASAVLSPRKMDAGVHSATRGTSQIRGRLGTTYGSISSA